MSENKVYLKLVFLSPNLLVLYTNFIRERSHVKEADKLYLTSHRNTCVNYGKLKKVEVFETLEKRPWDMQDKPSLKKSILFNK